MQRRQLTALCANAGDLHDKYLQQWKHTALTGSKLQRLARQLLEAVEHVHAQGFIHRDIKPTNILMKANGDILLADFGLALARDHQMAAWDLVCGTQGYYAPEVFPYLPEEGEGEEQQHGYYGPQVSPVIFIVSLILCKPSENKHRYWQQLFG